MRHGQTEWNAIHRLQGRSDIPLNEEGIKMAKRAHEEYKDLHIDICYSSPLKRAMDTAKIVLFGRDIDIITDDRLLEMAFGEYEGLQKKYRDPLCPLSVLFNDPKNYTSSVGGAESFDELFNRTKEFMQEIIEPQLKMNKDILIVGHAAMNSSIICQFKNKPVKDFWSYTLEQCKIIEL